MSPAIGSGKCSLCGKSLPVVGGRDDRCLDCRVEARCAGCGHHLSKHSLYANGGVNRHGSRLVCSVDNCHWQSCRFAEEGMQP